MTGGGVRGSRLTRVTPARWVAARAKDQDQELNEIAQAEFGKPYAELDTREQQHCAGKKGAGHRWAGYEGGGKPEEDEELERIAQKDFGKSYSELSSNEQQHCAGRKGQAHRHGTVAE